MVQPEEILIDHFSSRGIEAWSTLGSLDGVEEVVLINRHNATVESLSAGLDWLSFSYPIDLQCYRKGSQVDVYDFLGIIVEEVSSIYYRDGFVDVKIHSIGWLPPLNEMSGASLGIEITITKGEG